MRKVFLIAESATYYIEADTAEAAMAAIMDGVTILPDVAMQVHAVEVTSRVVVGALDMSGEHVELDPADVDRAMVRSATGLDMVVSAGLAGLGKKDDNSEGTIG